jgi:glycosyltransferase-like protein
MQVTDHCPDRLRIALFTYSTKPRGGVIHTLELANALHALGYFVTVYALDKDGQGFDFPLNCQCVLVPARSAPTNTDALIRQRIQEFVNYLNHHKPRHDIYHAQDCLSANALAALRQRQQIPHLIRTVHHIEDFQSPYLQHCQDRSIQLADLCLCVSDHWQLELKQQYQIYAARVMNGVNTHHFSPVPTEVDATLKQQLRLSGSPVYLTVGGIEPRKNSINLLRAFAFVLKDIPTAQLIIAGGATLFDHEAYRQEFLALATQLGITIGQSLILTGVLSNTELPALYRLADVFVFPSTKEGWGLALLEAIASGLPVITSNQPPFTEFLTDEQALLIDPDFPVAIAHAMHRVLQPGIAQSLVEQAQTVPATYTWEASAKMHVEHYQQLLRSSVECEV